MQHLPFGCMLVKCTYKVHVHVCVLKNRLVNNMYMYLCVAQCLDGGCAGAVIQDGQLPKKLSWSHGTT